MVAQVQELARGPVLAQAEVRVVAEAGAQVERGEASRTLPPLHPARVVAAAAAFRVRPIRAQR